MATACITANHVRIRAERQAGRRRLRPAARQLGRRRDPAQERSIPQLRLTERLAGCLVDARQPGKVQHQTLELVRQRIFGLACGYADCNDAARLADDPIHKLLLDRDPITGRALASQPTLSRFENAVRRGDLLRDMAHALADTVIETQRRRLKGRRERGSRSTSTPPTTRPTASRSSPSSTATTTPGATCRWSRTVTFNDETEQYAVAAVLRPGNAPADAGRTRAPAAPAGQAARRLSRRRRLGCGWTAASPARSCSQFLEQPSRSSTSWRWPAIARLEKRARRLMGKARMQSKATGQTAHLYGETRYAARKLDAQAARDHQGRGRPASRARSEEQPALRGDQPARHPGGASTQFYCGRGDVENRLKELHHGLELDRTSCSRFLANQFRVLLTAGGVRPVPGAAAPRRGHGLCRRPGHDAARAAAQARRVGRALPAQRHRRYPITRQHHELLRAPSAVGLSARISPSQSRTIARTP